MDAVAGTTAASGGATATGNVIMEKALGGKGQCGCPPITPSAFPARCGGTVASRRRRRRRQRRRVCVPLRDRPTDRPTDQDGGDGGGSDVIRGE